MFIRLFGIPFFQPKGLFRYSGCLYLFYYLDSTIMRLAAKRNYSPGFAGYRNFTYSGKEPLIRFLFILIIE